MNEIFLASIQEAYLESGLQTFASREGSEDLFLSSMEQTGLRTSAPLITTRPNFATGNSIAARLTQQPEQPIPEVPENKIPIGKRLGPEVMTGLLRFAYQLKPQQPQEKAPKPSIWDRLASSKQLELIDLVEKDF